MSFSNTRDIQRKMAKGEGYYHFAKLLGPSATTAAVAASGFHTVHIHWNELGTTLPSTRQSINTPTSPPASIFLNVAHAATTATSGYYLAWMYVIGTLALGTTGQQFTHNAATFPILRTQFGESSKPLSLVPIMQITTAPTGSVPSFIIRNTGPAAGYTDQDGNSVTGTVTFTLPSATTAINSAFVLTLESGDSGVRDISNIDVTATGSSSPAATIFGAELICPLGALTGWPTTMDVTLSGLHMGELTPGVATSGTASATLALLNFGLTTTSLDMPVFVAGTLNS